MEGKRLKFLIIKNFNTFITHIYKDSYNKN
jgi:hypothetical protein